MRKKHSPIQIATAYEMGKQVYLKQISRKDAIKSIESVGMANGSAKIYLTVHNHLMNGTFTSRTVKAKSFDYFLNNILKDFGQPKLSIALKTLASHIEYFEKIQKIKKMHLVRAVYQKYVVLNQSLQIQSFIDDEEESFPEGKEIYRLHRSKERNSELVKRAKAQYFFKNPKLQCQVCEISFTEEYGEIGKGYIEAHHLFPISELTEEIQTKIEDLVFLCSNCHKMVHRKRPWLTLEKLTNLLRTK